MAVVCPRLMIGKSTMLRALENQSLIGLAAKPISTEDYELTKELTAEGHFRECCFVRRAEQQTF